MPIRREIYTRPPDLCKASPPDLAHLGDVGHGGAQGEDLGKARHHRVLLQLLHRALGDGDAPARLVEGHEVPARHQGLGEVHRLGLVLGVGVHHHALHPQEGPPRVLGPGRRGEGGDAEIHLGLLVVAQGPGAVEDHGQGPILEGPVRHPVVHPLGDQVVLEAEVLDELEGLLPHLAPDEELGGVQVALGVLGEDVLGAEGLEEAEVEVGVADVVEEAEGGPRGELLRQGQKLLPGPGGFLHVLLVVDEGHALGEGGKAHEPPPEGEGLHRHALKVREVGLGHVLAHGLEDPGLGHLPHPVVGHGDHEVRRLALGGAQDELLLDLREGDLHHLHLGAGGPLKGPGLLLEPLQLGAAEVGPDGDLSLGEGQGKA